MCMLALMHLGQSTPGNLGGPCWHCSSFQGRLYAGSAAACCLAPGLKVRSLPASGCAFWLREVGSDDEPGPSAVFNAAPVLWPASGPAEVVDWAPSTG